MSVLGAVSDLSATDLANINTAWGTTHATTTAAQTAMATPTVAQYNVQLGTDGSVTERTGADSTNVSDNYITPGAGDNVIVLGTTTGVSVGVSSNEIVAYSAAWGNDVILNFDVAGNGVDHLNFSGIGATAAGSSANAVAGDATVATGLAWTAGKVWVEDLKTVDGTDDNDTETDVASLFTDAGTSTASANAVYVAVSTANVGTVYKIVNGTAIGDITATKMGTIDLADTAWSTLVTATSFTTSSKTAEGPSVSGLAGATLTAVNGAGAQALTGTTLNDTLDGSPAVTAGDIITYPTNGGTDTITMSTAAIADTVNVNAAGTATIPNFSAGGTADVLVVAAGATANVTVSGNFTATGATTNAGTVSMTAAAGVTIDMSAAGGANGYTLNADAGGSALTGGAGVDTIVGGAGIDTITTGASADKVNYLAGAAVSADADNISGFTAGAGGDVIGVDISAFAAGILAANAGTLVNVAGSADNQIIVDAADTGYANFLAAEAAVNAVTAATDDYLLMFRNTTTGVVELYADADSSVAGSEVLIASFTDITVVNSAVFLAGIVAANFDITI